MNRTTKTDSKMSLLAILNSGSTSKMNSPLKSLKFLLKSLRIHQTGSFKTSLLTKKFPKNKSVF